MSDNFRIKEGHLRDLPTSIIASNIILSDDIVSVVRDILLKQDEKKFEGTVVLGQDGTDRKRMGILLKPQTGLAEARTLQLIGALCVSKAISTSLLKETEVGWPGSVLLSGDPISQVDLEIDMEDEEIRSLVIWIDYHAPKGPEVIHTVRDILCFLDLNYISFMNGYLETMLDKWSDRCGILGKEVSIKLRSGTISGTALGIDQFGSLMIKDDQGMHRVVVDDFIEFI